jgi:hypothetical protein
MTNLSKYNERPSIWDVNSQYCQEFSQQYLHNFIRSTEAFISELLLFYPGRKIYFLARDMEYHYDISQLLLEEHPELQQKFKLINVSRESLKSTKLKQYCVQEGFLEEAKIVLVDSGFNGNIIERIKTQFKNIDIKGHLIFSENPSYPSSYATLQSLGIALYQDRWFCKKNIEQQIEQLSHFEGKAIEYEFHHEKLKPVSKKACTQDIWRNQSIKIMESIRYKIDCNEKKTWKERFEILKSLVDLVRVKNTKKVIVTLNADFLFKNLMPYNQENYEILSFPVNSSIGNCVNRTPQLTSILVPFGFADFLREVKERKEDGYLRVRLVSNCHLQEWISDLINSPTFCGKTLRYFGIETENTSKHLESDWYELTYPSRQKDNYLREDFDDSQTPQKSFTKLWRQVDKLNGQLEISQEQIALTLQLINGLPEGRGFIRDILEEHNQHRLGICFRSEIIGAIWNLIISNFQN